MNTLQTTVDQLREKIRHTPAPGLNEQNTKTPLIDPLLRALRWNVEDWEEVQREFKRQSEANPVDYVLMDRQTKTLLLFIEAKGLGENLDDPRWAHQIMDSAHVASVKWVVFTNGDEYRIYNAYTEGPIEKTLFRGIRIIGANDAEVESTLVLPSKLRLLKHEIEVIWKTEGVDSKVRDVIERFCFGAGLGAG